MNLLKKENWVVSLVLTILSEGIFTLVLGYLLKVYNKKAWYADIRYWVFGFLVFIFPAFIMLTVFLVQISCEVAKKLDVPGSEIYNSPYAWIICLIVPVIGWALLFVMLIYIEVWTIVMLYRGAGEKYIENN